MHTELMQEASLVHEVDQQCTDGSMDDKGVAQQMGGCWGSSEESAMKHATDNERKAHGLCHAKNMCCTHLINEVSQFRRYSHWPPSSKRHLASLDQILCHVAIFCCIEWWLPSNNFISKNSARPVMERGNETIHGGGDYSKKADDIALTICPPSHCKVHEAGEVPWQDRGKSQAPCNPVCPTGTWVAPASG